MRALDTNVLARWVLRDDEAQALAADALLREPSLITTTVMLELGWVLDKSLRLPRATVAGMLGQILDLATVTAEDSVALKWALDRYRVGADWADAVHLATAAGPASVFLTFDRKLVRKLGRDAPIDVLLAEV